MNKLAIVLVGIATVLILLGLKETKDITFSGVSRGQTYTQATTTGSFANASSTMLKIGPGEIGSVNIGVTSGTTFVLKDASSISDTSSTTIISLAASPAIGSSMELDLTFSKGLFIEFPSSFVGRYTITYR